MKTIVKKSVVLVCLIILFVFSCVTKTKIITDIDSKIDLSKTLIIDDGVWLKGDFHAHSLHSDGDSSVEDILRFAESRGLDFFALTDHDANMRGKPSQWSDEAYASKKMILLYGAEWTSGKGHANVISDAPFDYDELWKANLKGDAVTAAAFARKEGAIFSINHPASPFAPWLYDFEEADCIEVWNGPYGIPNKNSAAIALFWEEKLKRGLRIPVIGGSDSHHLKKVPKDYNPPGYPTTWVYAEKADGAGVLAAVRLGRASISYSPKADRLEWYADVDGDGFFETMMGDSIFHTPNGNPITFLARVVPADSQNPKYQRRKYNLIVVKNGAIKKRIAVKPGITDSVTFTDTPDGNAFYRVELRGGTSGGLLPSITRGDMVAMTNPIYVVTEVSP